MSNLPVIALTLGEPAGVGPDLALRLAREAPACVLAVIGDRSVLDARARRLGASLHYDYWPAKHRTRGLYLIHEATARPVAPGHLDVANAAHVLRVLDRAVAGCRAAEFDAMVTCPVHKGVINDSGIRFSGHTEYLASRTNADLPVMMLAVDAMRVALLTTHTPLSAVPALVTAERLSRTLDVLLNDLRHKLGIRMPRIGVCGLNPHAGEQGHLGTEEVEIIAPVIARYRHQGHRVDGPLPADTAFVPDRVRHYDVILCMYHDQGLPVIKHMGFDRAVNVTLGLPIIRTSVDHGTALEIAGTDQVNTDNIVAALDFALSMVRHRRAQA